MWSSGIVGLGDLRGLFQPYWFYVQAALLSQVQLSVKWFACPVPFWSWGVAQCAAAQWGTLGVE